jgi:hypothetical protein
MLKVRLKAGFIASLNPDYGGKSGGMSPILRTRYFGLPACSADAYSSQLLQQ